MRHLKGIIKIFYLFLIPIVFAFLFELTFKDFTFSRLSNVLENLLFTVFILIFSFLIIKLKHKNLFLFASIVLFNLCVLFESLYFYLFGNFLSASAIFVIIESNSNEINEFLATHIDLPIVFFALLIIFITIYSLIKFKKTVTVNSLTTSDKYMIFELLILTYFTLKISVLIVYNVPYLLIKAPISYYQEMKKFENYGKENKIGKFKNVTHDSKGEDKELYIIVIGESTNKKHFNLYNNYYRETTPLLNKMKEDLYIFNDVVSSHTYTIGALTKALTLGSYENPNGKYQGSIIQLLNQANFKTYWISNQRPVGMMDTHVTKIGLSASKSIFLNTKHTRENTIFDDELIKSMQDVIKEKGDKKVIFLHMLGTHASYENRYPKEDDYFQDIPRTKFKTENAYKIINAYDNAVRYHDKLLSQIIEVIKKENTVSYVLYFSDHGQEVFDDIDFVGHTIDENITKNMYEIPMFLWVSDKYKSKNTLNFDLNRKYMTDDVFHSIADISNVKCAEIDITRSIFNKSFNERKRIIKDSLDYDTFFNDLVKKK